MSLAYQIQARCDLGEAFVFTQYRMTSRQKFDSYWIIGNLKYWQRTNIDGTQTVLIDDVWRCGRRTKLLYFRPQPHWVYLPLLVQLAERVENSRGGMIQEHSLVVFCQEAKSYLFCGSSRQKGILLDLEGLSNDSTKVWIYLLEMAEVPQPYPTDCCLFCLWAFLTTFLTESPTPNLDLPRPISSFLDMPSPVISALGQLLKGIILHQLIQYSGGQMGKKFVPVKINGCSYRIYLDNVEKIFKRAKKTHLPIPAFQKKMLSRKSSVETCPDCTPFFDTKTAHS